MQEQEEALRRSMDAELKAERKRLNDQGLAALKQQLTAQLAARARQNPLYAMVAGEIQILSAGITVLLDASGRAVPEVMDVVYVEAGD